MWHDGEALAVVESSYTLGKGIAAYEDYNNDKILKMKSKMSGVLR